MGEQKFSGWMVAVGAFILMFTIMGSMSTFPVFMLDILTVNDMEMNILMLIVVFSTIATTSFSIWAGQVLDKLGIRKLLFLVLISNFIHWVCMAYSTAYWMLFLTAFIGGINIAFSTFVPTAILINRWFIEKRATVIGFIYSGQGFGGALFIPLTGALLNRLSNYRRAYVVLGIITSIIILVCLFLMKDSPEKYGEKPYGWQKAEEIAAQEAVNQSKGLAGLSFEAALRTSSFWLCIVAILLTGILNSAINFVIPYLTISGIAAVTASRIAGLLTLIMGGAIIVFGMFADKFGVRKFAVLTGGLLALAMFLFAGIRMTVISSIIVCAIYGCGNAYSSSIQSLLPNPVFGPKEYQKIVGPFNGALALGGSIGAVGLATIVGAGDVTESYQGMFNIAGVIAIMSVVLILIAFSLRPYKESKQCKAENI